METSRCWKRCQRASSDRGSGLAVRLQFINLIVPIPALERVLADQGGFAGFIATQGGFLGEMVWHDEHLCRVDGAMNWDDVDVMVERWESCGLQGLVGGQPYQWWKDFAVCASRRGPTFPCDWLSYDPADNCVFLAGKEKGQIIGPPL